MTDPPFEFAVVSPGTDTRREWLDLARRAEDLGYDALLVTDHVGQPLAPLSALAFAGAVTSRIRLGTYMLGNDFRNPVLLAKEIATAALLCERRIDVGVGAGWLLADYTNSGVAFECGARRLARLREGITILRALLVEGRCEFHGGFYDVTVDDFGPVPTIGPRLLMGGGRRGLLGYAARVADVVSFVPRATAAGTLDDSDRDPAGLDEKLSWVRAAADGPAAPPVFNHVLWECLVTPRPEPILDLYARSMGRSPGEVGEIPSLLIGTVDSVIETLLARRDRWGLSMITVPATAIQAFAPVVAALSGK